VPHASSLSLGTAMTLEAWVLPSAQNGWRAILQKEVDAYFLHASSTGALLPAAGGTFNGSVSWFNGPGALATGVWSHVAVTWNGTIMRLYVNGTEVATLGRTGTLQATTTPLRIGGNTYAGEFFAGRIDEVRIYNRALSAAEVTADMNTPIGPVGPDTTAPSVPGGLGATAVSGTQVNLSWTASTDNVGVSGYLVERCEAASCAYAQIATPTTTSYNDTTAVASTSYNYRVRATDAAGNLSGYSNVASATTPTPDTTPPSAPAGLGSTAINATQIDLSWGAATDNVAVTGYRLERCTGAGCGTFAEIATPTGTAFSNTGLAASTTYRYRVRATDAAGNLGGYSNILEVSTTAVPDTTPPSTPAGLGTTVVSPTQIDLAWTASTDNIAVTGYQIDRCTGAGCTTFAQIGTSPTPSFSNTGLTASTTYRYRVRAVDGAGNPSANSAIVTATTQGIPDTMAPTTPTGLAATAVSGSQVNLTWTASSDNVGVTGYQLERCTGPSCTTFAQIATPTTNSYSDTTGLVASTAYRYRVRATDAAANLSGYSNIASATTLAVAGPLVAYGFNEGAGTTTIDGSGHGTTGTLLNGTTWIAGQTGTAVSFDGSNDQVSLPTSVDVAALPFTLEAWVRPTSYASWRAIFAKRSSYSASGMRFDVGLWTGNGRVFVTTYNSTVQFTYTPPLTTWTHLAVVATSTGTQLYVNGALSETLGAVTLGTGAGAAVNIGRTGDNDDPFAGGIDDLRLYTRALTQAEIQSDMNTPVAP
jgi:fibronectin type 3 domain-containing protein